MRVEWEEMSVRVICFRMIKARVNGKVLKMVVRPAVMGMGWKQWH